MKAHEFLNLMAKHQGRANGIGVAALSRLTGLPERDVRFLVTDLRKEGTAICGTPSTGYFIAVTPEELQETCAFLHHRAMSSLVISARMQNISLPGLLGQLMLNQA